MLQVKSKFVYIDLNSYNNLCTKDQVGFSRPRKWPTKFHIKFRNTAPLPPIKEIFLKKLVFFTASLSKFRGGPVKTHPVYIAYHSELNLQICIYEQKRRIYRENSKYLLDENSYGHFCPRRMAANFCHPGFRHNK